MRSWLGGFPYRISLNAQLGFFVLAGAVAFAIAHLSVAFQAVKADLTDPEKNFEARVTKLLRNF